MMDGKKGQVEIILLLIFLIGIVFLFAPDLFCENIESLKDRSFCDGGTSGGTDGGTGGGTGGTGTGGGTGGTGGTGNESGGPPSEICDPSGWTIVYTESVNQYLEEDTAGSCRLSNSDGTDYIVSSDTKYCYQFRYTQSSPLEVSKDGREWNTVEILGNVQIDTDSENWENQELSDFQCGYLGKGHGGSQEDVIAPNEDKDTCSLQCVASDAPGVNSADLDFGPSSVYCAPTQQMCEDLEQPFQGTCGTKCYGEEIEFSIGTALMNEGKCTSPTNPADDVLTCSSSQPMTVKWPTYTFQVYRTNVK